MYSSLDGRATPKVTAEIDTAALRHNYRALTGPVLAAVPSARNIGVVKADFYGHSVDICVPVLIDEGCGFFAVSSLAEAAGVRKIAREAGAHPDILILGYTATADAPLLSELDVIQACLSEDYAVRLSRAAGNGRVRVHIKIDTGMNRVGLPAHTEEEIEETGMAAERIAALPGLRVDGVFSHFARADETGAEGLAATRRQAGRFLAAVAAAEARGVVFGMKHISASFAGILYPEYYMDGCRFGISLVGVDAYTDGRTGLRPVMTLRSEVGLVHRVLKGESVSYGGTFTAPRDMTVATIPAGYADGFSRSLSGARLVITRRDGADVPATVIGRVCMDACVVDVTDLGVREGDPVTILGLPGQLEDLCARAKTIPNELFCGISGRVPRIPRQ
jgi:alanine racemase